MVLGGFWGFFVVFLFFLRHPKSPKGIAAKAWDGEARSRSKPIERVSQVLARKAKEKPLLLLGLGWFSAWVTQVVRAGSGDGEATRAGENQGDSPAGGKTSLELISWV